MAGDQRIAHFRRQQARTEAVLRTLVLRAMQPAGVLIPFTTNSSENAISGVGNSDLEMTKLFPELSMAPNKEQRVSIWWPAESEFFAGTVLDSIPACYVTAGRTLACDTAREDVQQEDAIAGNDDTIWHLVLYDDGDAEWVRLDQERQRAVSDSESADRHMDAIASLYQLLETRNLQKADKAEIEIKLEGIQHAVRSGKYDVESGGGGDSAFIADATAALWTASSDSEAKAASMARAFEEYAVGVKVQANWKVGKTKKWFTGSITKARNVDGCRHLSVVFESDNQTAAYVLPQDLADLRLDTEIRNTKVHAAHCMIKTLGQIQTKWSTEIETLPEKSVIMEKQVDEFHKHASQTVLPGCIVCHQLKDSAKVLLCDGCDSEVHMYCCTPPLHSVPEGDFYCAACKAGLSGAESLESTFSLNTLMAALPLHTDPKEFAPVPGIRFVRTGGKRPHEEYNVGGKEHTREELEQHLEEMYAADGLVWLGRVVRGRWQCRADMALHALRFVVLGLVRSGHLVQICSGSLKNCENIAQLVDGPGGASKDTKSGNESEFPALLAESVEASAEEAALDGFAFIVANQFVLGWPSGKRPRDEGGGDGALLADGYLAAAARGMAQPESELTEYELQRRKRIAENNALLAGLSLPTGL
jgi:hypothetical protein